MIGVEIPVISGSFMTSMTTVKFWVGRFDLDSADLLR